jgi:hypothetical protein
MSGTPVKRPATKNRPAAVGFVTQALAEGKSYCRWKIAERCQLRRRTTTVQLLCDGFFLMARRRHSKIFNEKLKLAGALNSAPAA